MKQISNEHKKLIQMLEEDVSIPDRSYNIEKFEKFYDAPWEVLVEACKPRPSIRCFVMRIPKKKWRLGVQTSYL